ncbi:MAG: hypothetical protein ACRDT6_14865 [Micromonosporaceae bacterium]
MGVGELLRQLDATVLPPLSRALSWFLRGAVRRRLLLSGGVIAAFALLMASVWAARQPPTSPTPVGHLVRVGVSDGQSVSSYAAESEKELADLAHTGTGPAYALVSFTAYLAPDRFGAVLRDVEVHRGHARAPLPGVATDVVEITIRTMPGDLRTGMAGVAEDKAALAEAYRRDAAKLTGSSEVERSQRESYQTKADNAAAEAAAYQSMCSCLYAAVVRGTPSALDRLGQAAGVRTVDPAPEVRALDRAVFVPPIPEDPDNSEPPRTGSPSPSPSGVPSDTPSPTTQPSDSASPSPSPSKPSSASPSGSGTSSSHSPDDTGEGVEPESAETSPAVPGTAG